MSTNTEARLADLAQRNAIAREELGAQGEKLKAILDKRAAAALRPLEGGDPTAPHTKRIFDFFVWSDFGTGAFENVLSITLRWVSGEAAKSRLLEYTPDPIAPFAFTTSDGRRIEPGIFLTDGGTIPAFATAISGIDRFAYLPAYLIHDWEYVLHHCNQLPPEVTREDADRGLLEALKTMMTSGLVSESRSDFWAIETALANFASRYWDASTPCSLE